MRRSVGILSYVFGSAIQDVYKVYGQVLFLRYLCEISNHIKEGSLKYRIAPCEAGGYQSIIKWRLKCHRQFFVDWIGKICLLRRLLSELNRVTWQWKTNRKMLLGRLVFVFQPSWNPLCTDDDEADFFPCCNMLFSSDSDPP